MGKLSRLLGKPKTYTIGKPKGKDLEDEIAELMKEGRTREGAIKFIDEECKFVLKPLSVDEMGSFLIDEKAPMKEQTEMSLN